MPHELHDLLTRAAPSTPRPPDIDAAWHRGERLRRRRRGRRVLTVAATVAFTATVVVVAVGRAGPTPSITTTPANGTFTDPVQGYSVRIPHGWSRADQPLTPDLYNPTELLAAATVPLHPDPTGPACDAQLPKSVVDSLRPTDAFVWVVEANTAGPTAPPTAVAVPGGFPDRPAHFATARFRSFDCSGPARRDPNARFQELWFHDGTRVLGAYVALGRQVSAARRTQSFALLDSLHLTVPAPAGSGVCTAEPDATPPDATPADVAAWAHGQPLVGSGGLWAVRATLDGGAPTDGSGWVLKLSWYLHPATGGTPTVTARQLDGPGHPLHIDSNAATDQRGTFATSGLELSALGCWQVTAHYQQSVLTVRIPVHAP